MKQSRVFNTLSGNKLVIAICIFVLLDCSILGINIFITHQVEQDALAINIAGRQRMLSQRFTKSLLLIQQSAQPEAYLQELKYSYSRFVSTLQGFTSGGTVFDGADNPVWIRQIQDEKVQAILSDTWAIITPLQPLIEAQLAGNNSPRQQQVAVQTVQQENLKVLKLMNSLTLRIEQLSKIKTSLIRQVQSAALLFTLVNFFFVVKYLLQRTRQAQAESRSLLDLIDNTSACLLLTDTRGRIVMSNKASQEAFGYSADEFSCLNWDKLLQTDGGQDHVVCKNGPLLPVELKQKKVRFNGVQYRVMTLVDLSRVTEEHARLAYMANHDPLTGLVNRRVLFDRIELELRHARRSALQLGVFFVDLDKFKAVNDTYGHKQGDEILVKVASRLQHAVRETDTVARYGGDEFILLMTGVSDKAQFEAMKHKLRSAFAVPFDIEGKPFQIDASVGFACYPADANNAADLVQHADQLMFAQKDSEYL
ncbi:diguanylate cyclase domain-containing protein [Pontibacter sp. JAM-7]|uniref:diguanylate cyclase domain-containing protein n=1 Tax=Pontibacter sp. JAM-7 TaxID=3366581 RepID=UPI003AF668AF